MKQVFKRVSSNPSALSLAGIGLLCLLTTGGCGSSGRQLSRSPASSDRYGRTYYIDGAGNWGYGVSEVRLGLRKAGYRGNIINYRWSPTFNPALDQTIGRAAAKGRGKELARQISSYLRNYPENEVNIIALSAGTGVAVWACENLQPPAKVNTLILLGSSLSSRYDMTEALENISGGVWVYFSRNDQILSGPVRALGTIDGHMIADSAGLVGLHPCSGTSDKIHNVGWSEQWEPLGWSGSHTDATSEPFVRQVLARHIIANTSEEAPKTPEDTGEIPEGTADLSSSFQKTQSTTQPALQAAAHEQ